MALRMTQREGERTEGLTSPRWSRKREKTGSALRGCPAGLKHLAADAVHLRCWCLPGLVIEKRVERRAQAGNRILRGFQSIRALGRVHVPLGVGEVGIEQRGVQHANGALAPAQ